MAASRRRLWRECLISLVALAAVAGVVWAGTTGTPAFLDATGKLRPVLSGVPIILAPDTDENIELMTAGSGAVIINGTTLPYTPTLQDACDNDTGDCTITGLTASRKLILEGDTAGAARFEIYESGGNMFFACLQDDDSACHHIFELATGRKFAVGSASIPDGLNIIAGEPETLDLIERSGNPATPGSTRWKLFFKSTGLHIIDDAGAVTGPLGSGGSGSNAPIRPYSAVAISAGTTYGCLMDGDEMLCYLAATNAAFTADATWRLGFQLPPALPTGCTWKLQLDIKANATANTTRINPKWAPWAPGAVRPTSLTAETVIPQSVTGAAGSGDTVTFGTGDANQLIRVKWDLNGTTFGNAGDRIAMDLVVEDASNTLAVDLGTLPSIICE